MEVLRTRLCQWRPAAIDAVALAPAAVNGVPVPEPRLAVGRSNGVIELWDTATWHLHSCTAGHSKRSIRSLIWVTGTGEEDSAKQRLFSAGLHREISEWDPLTLQQLGSASSGGGPVWGLTSSGLRVYAACEDGTIRIFSAQGEPGELMHQGRLHVGKSRLLSVAAFGEDYVFAGGADSRIAKWSLGTRTCEASMQVEKARGAETLVWALVALGDHGLASGDSLGLVHIWDPVACVVRHRFAQHQADVLSLAAAADGSWLAAAGVDTKISLFSKGDDGEERWVFRNAEFGHTHDIKAMAIDEVSGFLASGGVAGALRVNEPKLGGHTGRDRLSKRCLQLSGLSPVLQTASVAPASRLLLCQRDAQLELWYLQQPKPKEGAGTPMPEAQHVLRVSLEGAKEGRHIGASAIAPDGQHFAASDESCTRLFRANLEDLEVRRVEGLPKEFEKLSARTMLFCGSGMLAVAPRAAKEILVLDVGASSVAARLKKHKAPVCLMATEGEWLASADLTGAVHVFSLDKLQHHARVPGGGDRGEFPTALGFDAGRQRLIVALSSHKLLLFDVEARALVADVPSIVPLPRKVVPPFARVCGIEAPQEGEGKFLLWGHSFMSRVHIRARENDEERAAKKRKRKKSADGGQEPAAPAPPPPPPPQGGSEFENCDWHVYEGMQHIVSMHLLPESQWGKPLLSDINKNASRKRKGPNNKGRVMVLTMEVAPSTIQASLPQAFERKAFVKDKR